MNFTRDVVDAAPRARRALVAIDRAGARTELSFGEVSHRAARIAGTLATAGVGRGDIVMTIVGNRPEWVLTLLACFRIGAVALPCAEQLRAPDLRARMDATEPALVVADERNADTVRASGFSGTVLDVSDPRLADAASVGVAGLTGDDPALIVLTSGAKGEHKPTRHGQR
ncbi:MAG: AMP-binding protein, partial [Thermoleophilaceae bacterium]